MYRGLYPGIPAPLSFFTDNDNFEINIQSIEKKQFSDLFKHFILNVFFKYFEKNDNKNPGGEA